MTSEQFERWKDFALRMARTCYSAMQRAPSRKWIIERVEDFLAEMEPYHARISDWDSTWKDSLLWAYPCVSDHMLDFEWDRMPWCVRRLERYEDDRFETARDRWFDPVRCCVRAGLDMASKPSAGVVGFTLGDLRKMYPEGIPEWIATGFTDRRGRAMTSRRLARFKSSEPVWL